MDASWALLYPSMHVQSRSRIRSTPDRKHIRRSLVQSITTPRTREVRVCTKYTKQYNICLFFSKKEMGFISMSVKYRRFSPTPEMHDLSSLNIETRTVL